MKKQNKVVRVKWIDSCSRGRWTDVERAREYELGEIETIGFQVHRNRQKVVVALNRDKDGDVSDVITIPMSCVKNIERIDKS